MNFDKDVENLRKMFERIISDCAAQKGDICVERLFYQKLGELSDFFGSKGTVDMLFPLLSTSANQKNFLIRRDCLKSVLNVGLKVGK